MAKKKPKQKLDTYCEHCLSRQVLVKKAVTCSRGHDKVTGISKEEKDEILERKNKFSVGNSINIQIGDDDGEHGELFYRILGVQGNLTLRAYRIEESEYEGEKKHSVNTTYGPHLQWAMKRILEEELKDADAATLGQLLDVVNNIQARLDSLEETIFYLSEEGEEDE